MSISLGLRPSLLLAVVLSLTLALSASCGFGRMGTGVVVWAPEGSTLHNGTLVWVWEQSRIRKSYKIQVVGDSNSVETDTWRIRFFSDEGQAKAFAATFAPLKDSWALSGKQGLPIRETPDANASRIYKLALNEEVKVLSKQASTAKEGNLEGTWMEVLTKDGYSGWVFDFYLKLYEKQNGVNQQVKDSGPGDAALQSLLRETWYPEEYQAMVVQDRINLDAFKPEYGFHADLPSSSFLLVEPGQQGNDSFTFPFTDTKKIDVSTYSFTGANNLKVHFTDSQLKRIEVQFRFKDQDHSETFVLLDDDIGTLISQELASRQSRLDELLNRGKTLFSPTYGTIVVQDDGSFAWTGYQVLQQASTPFFPANLTGRGKILFDRFKDTQMVGDYKAVRFEFEADGGTFSQVFLYRYIKDGFQLLPIVSNDVDPVKLTVLRESRSGIFLFFNFQH